MSKKLHSLDALKELKLKSAKPTLVEQAKAALRQGAKGRVAPAGPKAKAPEAAPQVEVAGADEHLFFSAMQGVEQIGGAGRQIQPPPPPVPEPEDEEGDPEARLMRQAMQGPVEFELELCEEYMHGYVRGLDSKIFQQLKAGRLSPEGHLDLHGQNADQALDSLLFFMRESYLAGRRMVLVIPGRGKNSPKGLSILRQELQAWLTREPLRRITLAFCTAQPKDGGAGALYVLLRKMKKSQGKVAWDKQMNWEEMER
ncbi:DNA-nicking endonuclease, Smr domain [Humidesulfovibrio mexicanus]|uniref:DNA-nicking endonuclease, Smr domain n=1 Tax=Humidesulfovibrio mexicanus TaxID=147047 RepID=A0A239CW15_9BACT|nr:Smr/MutS family protein [Humidesulfovibrio mexicanus]SNS24267.1 DNA-nicking endonuclease, Smr domain [Humidesulfovibrio mexicanus]